MRFGNHQLEFVQVKVKGVDHRLRHARTTDNVVTRGPGDLTPGWHFLKFTLAVPQSPTERAPRTCPRSIEKVKIITAYMWLHTFLSTILMTLRPRYSVVFARRCLAIAMLDSYMSDERELLYIYIPRATGSAHPANQCVLISASSSHRTSSTEECPVSLSKR